MESASFLGQRLQMIGDTLALGLSMFGDHVIWLMMLPPLWIIAACLIWMKMEDDDRERDRSYVALAERNMPDLREVTKRRSTEVLKIRPMAEKQPK